MNVAIRLRAVWRDDSGQDLLEYALLASLIAMVAYVAVESTGGSVSRFYDAIAAKMDGVLP
jgi:Flp pilus assembly pilin Flp